MTDFFSRMFALPSDDEDSGSESNDFVEDSRGRKHYHNKRRVERSRSLSSSSTSSETKEDYSPHRRSHHGSGRKKYRGRQRRNDVSARSESRRRHSKKSQSSSSPSMKLTLHSPSRDRRSSKDSSKKADEKESFRSPTKKKAWRSKLSGGVRKHLSPGQSDAKAKSRPAKSKRDENRNAPPKQPINIGDSITISQQFLDQEAEMSVLTIPRELVMEEEGIEHDHDDGHLDLRRAESAPSETDH
eukprot:scaffold33615_cov101-Skeletonema_dohrnii-CCMP3373.AAC.7